jgi:hypothetical protein
MVESALASERNLKAAEILATALTAAALIA